MCFSVVSSFYLNDLKYVFLGSRLCYFQSHKDHNGISWFSSASPDVASKYVSP
jgi:hypothetical protein